MEPIDSGVSLHSASSTIVISLTGSTANQARVNDSAKEEHCDPFSLDLCTLVLFRIPQYCKQGSSNSVC